MKTTLKIALLKVLFYTLTPVYHLIISFYEISFLTISFFQTWLFLDIKQAFTSTGWLFIITPIVIWMLKYLDIIDLKEYKKEKIKEIKQEYENAKEESYWNW
jgi:uncharacterized membrane protein (DUF485 family)